MAKKHEATVADPIARPAATDPKPEAATAPTPNLPSVPEQKTNLPAVNHDDTEASAAFRGALAEAPRMALPMITTIQINHAQRKFMVNGEIVDSVEGYPIRFFQMRGWWEKGYTPGSHEIPACYSNDMVVPSEQSTKKQSDKCATCKKAQFGSHPQGKGQACKTTTLLFVGDPDNRDQPISVMFLPPTSIKTLMGSSGRFPKPGYLQLVQNMTDPETKKKVKIPQLAWTRWKCVEGAPESIHAVLDPEFLRACPSREKAEELAALINTNIDAMDAFRGDVSVLAGEE